MRLERLRAEEVPRGRRISAQVVWEGPHRGPDTLWWETDPAFAADFDPTPEAFAVAAMPLACGLGEPRLRVEGTLCARLREGLEASMRLFEGWYRTCRAVPVEATEGFVTLEPAPRRRAGAFLSGGIDSLSMFRANRLAHPEGDPARFLDAIHLFGWHLDDLEGTEPRPERWRVHRDQQARMRRLGERAGFQVLPVRSNLRHFQPSYEFSHDVGFGAGMIAVAHAFRRRLTEVGFASTGDVTGEIPHASHPLLDHLHSSGAVATRMEEPRVTRFAKARAVAAWEDALPALQVCLLHECLPSERANCGRCEKCLRTTLEFIALGALERATSLPRRDLVPDDLATVRFATPTQHRFALETVAGLRAHGRADLADAVEAGVRRSIRHARHKAWRRWLLRRPPSAAVARR